MVGSRQFDEEAVMRAALEIFMHKGLQQTTISDIARATGVLRGSLYNAYGSKEAIYHLAFARYQQEVLQSFASALQGGSLREVLGNIFAAAIGNIRGEGQSTGGRGCLTTRMALDDAPLGDGAVQEGLRHLLAELEALLAQRLQVWLPNEGNRNGAKQNGDGNSSRAISAQEMARLIITFTRGLAVIDRLYDDPQRLAKDCEGFVTSLAAMASAANK